MQSDRVEIHPTQLAEAATEADIMSQTSGRETRVVGWYHSHPHITPMPSHVDVRTQGTYQLMDSSFVGLIFAVFTPPSLVQTSCFQALSRPDSSSGSTVHECVEVPLEIIDRTAAAAANLPPCPRLASLIRTRAEEIQAEHANRVAKAGSVLSRIRANATAEAELTWLLEVFARPALRVSK